MEWNWVVALYNNYTIKWKGNDNAWSEIKMVLILWDKIKGNEYTQVKLRWHNMKQNNKLWHLHAVLLKHGSESLRGSRLRERGSRARVTGSEGKGQRVRG